MSLYLTLLRCIHLTMLLAVILLYTAAVAPEISAAEPSTNMHKNETPQDTNPHSDGTATDEASESDYNPPASEEPYSLIGETFETTLKHETLSLTIENYSRKIDSFFGDESLFEERTNTYASVRLSSLYGRGGETTFDAKFRLRLDLPQTEHKLKLRFESEDDEFIDDETSPSPPGQRTVGDTDLNASLQYIFSEDRKWTTSISPGLKIRDPLDPFVKLRLRRGFSLGMWNSRIIQTFEWYNSTGYGSNTTLIFERNLWENSFLRTTSQAYRNEEEFIHGDFEVSQRIYLFHLLRPRVAISTEAAVIGNTRPGWHHDRYYVNFRLRRDIHKGFVFLEVKPQIDFFHENNFHGEPSITLELEVLYGASYVKRPE